VDHFVSLAESSFATSHACAELLNLSVKVHSLDDNHVVIGAHEPFLSVEYTFTCIDVILKSVPCDTNISIFVLLLIPHL
jgi:hypothetical protein